MFARDEIVTYLEMCSAERMSLQHGMNYREDDSIFLMSLRAGAPYSDNYDRERQMLIYEGHDIARREGGPEPKSVDQPLDSKSRNAKFFAAAQAFRSGARQRPLQVRVYEKLKDGIWAFNGTFALEDAWLEAAESRKVAKFGLRLLDDFNSSASRAEYELPTGRIIPSSVKQEVFKRDKGQCVLCGSKVNLHFDHDLAYKHGGTSLLASNIRLLCATHNLRKGARIE